MAVACLVSHPSRFQAGRLAISAGVEALAQRGELDPVVYLKRHLNGDWGDISEASRRANEAALQAGDNLFSSYRVSPTLTLWIITEADRSATTLLLPDEY